MSNGSPPRSRQYVRLMPRFLSCSTPRSAVARASFFLLLLPMSAALVIPVYVDAVTIVMGAARNRIRKMMHKRKEVRANAASTMPCKVPCSRCLGVSVYSSALQEVQRRILVDDFFVRCTAGGGPRCCRS